MPHVWYNSLNILYTQLPFFLVFILNARTMKQIFLLIFSAVFVLNTEAQLADEPILLRDIPNDPSAPAKMIELNIPSGGSKLQGLMYMASGNHLHPTIFLLHGYPGNERNLDLAQVLRANGWNVIYFNYRGAWGSQGQFSLKNCVEDVVNAVHYIEKEKKQFKVDTSNLVLFGHSMGGWVTLKSVQQLPEIKKAFVLSTWDIAASFKAIKTEKELLTHRIEDLNNVLYSTVPTKYFICLSFKILPTMIFRRMQKCCPPKIFLF